MGYETALEDHYAVVRQRLFTRPPAPAKQPSHRVWPEQAEPVRYDHYAPDRHITSKSVLEEVRRKHGISREQMTGRGGTRKVTNARHEAFWRLRHELRRLSLPAIGRIMGGFDHSSVLSGIKRHQAKLDAGQAL